MEAGFYQQKPMNFFRPLQKQIRRRLKTFTPAQLGKNGKHMLETPYEQLLLSAGQVFITDPCDDSADGFLEEDAHVDGGAGTAMDGTIAIQCPQLHLLGLLF